jgi:hypothetical protein
VHQTRRRATSLFSYAKPNKQVRVFAVTSFNGYEPEGREFESLRAHLWYPTSEDAPFENRKGCGTPVCRCETSGCLNPLGAFNQNLEIENVTVRHPPKLEVESQITAAH